MKPVKLSTSDQLLGSSASLRNHWGEQKSQASLNLTHTARRLLREISNKNKLRGETEVVEVLARYAASCLADFPKMVEIATAFGVKRDSSEDLIPPHSEKSVCSAMRSYINRLDLNEAIYDLTPENIAALHRECPSLLMVMWGARFRVPSCKRIFH
jgi:hypothetical protein